MFAHSIVTINWRYWEQTIDWVQYISAQSLDNVLVVIVENGSGNGSLEQIVNYLSQNFQQLLTDGEANSRPSFDIGNGSQLLLIVNEENLGFSGGANSGIKAVRAIADLDVLLINNDAYLSKENIEVIKASAHSQSALVSPEVLKYGSETERAFFPNQWPHLLFGLSTSLSTELSARFVETGYLEGSILYLPDFFIEKKMTADGFIFDENFFLYCEDVDLSLSARRLGFKCLIDTTARGNHKISFSSGGEGSLTAYYYITRNRIYLAKKWLSKMGYLLFMSYYLVSRFAFSFKRVLSPKGLKINGVVFDAILDALFNKYGPKKNKG